MSLLRRKNWWKAVIYSRITLGLILAVSLVVAFSVYDRYVIEREVFERRVQKEDDLRKLEERKNILESKVDYLSDEQGVEAEIRRHFDVAREGEKVVVLLGDDKASDEVLTLPSPTPEVSAWKGFWAKFIPW